MPFRVNWTLRLPSSPGTPPRLWDQVNPVKAFVRLLNEPVAVPPMFAFKPPTGIRPPVSLANSEVRSAVIVEPLVLLLGKGFGPPVAPVLQYDHDEGTTVIGGFVYRGNGIPELQGKYIFGDWGAFAAPAARLFAGDLATGAIEELNIDNMTLNMWLQGFGQDDKGELYLLGSTSLGPAGLTGQIFKISAVPIPAAVYLFGTGLLGLAGLARRRMKTTV